MHQETKVKIQEIRKNHAAEKGADLSHYREFKTLTEVLKKQREAEDKASKRLAHIYGEEHPEVIKYNA